MHAAAALLPDGRVLVLGGWSYTSPGKGHILASAEIYDPRTGAFTKTGAMAQPDDGGRAVALLDGRVLVVGCGGFGKDTNASTSAELYDPKTGTFQATGRMVGNNYCGEVTRLIDGRVLFNQFSKSPAGVLSLSAELYDPASGTFSATGAVSPSETGPDGSYFAGYSATLMADGRVLFVGGCYGYLAKQGKENCDGRAEIYDPATGHVSPVGGSLGFPRSGHTATLLPDGRVLIAEGGATSGSNLVQTEVYDPVTETFESTGGWLHCPRGPEQHNGPTVTPLVDGRVLFAGGADYPCDAAHPAASAEIYDPRTDDFTLIKQMPISVGVGACAVRLLDGRVLIAGGGGLDDGTSYKTAELFQP